MEQQAPINPLDAAGLTIDDTGDQPRVVVSLDAAEILALIPDDVVQLAVTRAQNEKLSRYVLEQAGRPRPMLAPVTNLDEAGLDGLLNASTGTLRGILENAGVEVPEKARRNQSATLCAAHATEVL